MTLLPIALNLLAALSGSILSPSIALIDEPAPAAKYPLHPKDASGNRSDKEITVLIWCAQRDGLSTELAGADRELNDNMIRILSRRVRKTSEKVKIVSSTELAEYRSKHPNCNQMDLAKAFEANCFICLNIIRARLYEPNTAKTIYDGGSDLECSIAYLSEGTSPQIKRYDHHFAYKMHRHRAAEDISLRLFRAGFLDALANELCAYHLEPPQEVQQPEKTEPLADTARKLDEELTRLELELIRKEIKSLAGEEGLSADTMKQIDLLRGRLGKAQERLTAHSPMMLTLPPAIANWESWTPVRLADRRSNGSNASAPPASNVPLPSAPAVPGPLPQAPSPSKFPASLPTIPLPPAK
ncbi:MAG TPA: hypothetical protein VN641_17715 [Urbifossiella sp.]|nr:hypothetical protein [Urbifossiella sp.]